jgi:outer membrane protein TolC
MRSSLLSIPILAIAGCAGASTAGAHTPDAMVAQLRALERERHPASTAEGEPADRKPADKLELGGGALDRAALVTAVLARNPELDAAREAWRAATASYAPAVAIADPRLTYEVAPLSISGDVAFGERVELAQRLPYPGKRALAGDAAVAGAEAARADYRLLRLQLAEATVSAFDDYYVAARALEVNEHHRAMLERIHSSATAQYAVGRAAQQDLLEAESEIIALDRERLMLDAQHTAAIARINRLLHRLPDAPLPPPPSTLEIAAPPHTATAPDPLGPGDRAGSDARGDRPSSVGRGDRPGSVGPSEPSSPDAHGGALDPGDRGAAGDRGRAGDHDRRGDRVPVGEPGDQVDPTAAAQARLRARAVELASAERAFYPDLELMASYDSMFADTQHRFTVGVAIEIPLWRGARHASVERARAALAGATAELEAIQGTLAEDRDRARREVDEAAAAVELYERRAVPNARARVDAALGGFTAAQTSFSAVMNAERALREIELAVERARGDLDRRIAALDRLLGWLPGRLPGQLPGRLTGGAR